MPQLHLTDRLSRAACAPFLLLAAACATTASVPEAPPTDLVDAARWEVLGRSAEDRPVRARTLGGAERPRVAVIAGIHGDEQEGLRHLEALVGWLRGARARVRLYEDLNPDGSARGTRHNVHGVDPNRNWPASNFEPSPQRGPAPLSEPGVAAAHADLVRFDPELVIVLHSTSRGPFVNFDGPAAGYAERFADAAGAATGDPWHVVPDMGYATPGSFGSWMGKDRQVPTLTVELRRGAPPSDTGPALRAGFDALLGGRLDVPFPPPPRANRVR